MSTMWLHPLHSKPRTYPVVMVMVDERAGYIAACVALAAQGADKRNDELPLLPTVEPRPLIRPYVDRAPLTWRHQSRVLRCSGERDKPRHFTGSVVEPTRAIRREFLDAVDFPVCALAVRGARPARNGGHAARAAAGSS